MISGAASARAGARRAADAALVVLAIVLVVFTAVVISVPGVAPAVVNDRFDVAIVTAATLVSVAVAAMAWQRGRVSHDPAALLRASAFAVLALLNGLTLAIGLIGADASLGATLDDPGQLPLVAAVVSRSVAALLLVAAGWITLSRGVPSLSAPAVLLAPFGLVAITVFLAALARDSLPFLAPPQALAMLASDPTRTLPLGSAPMLAFIQSAIGIGFLAAGVLAHRAYRRSGRAGDALLAAGLVIAAVSQVHAAIHPGSYSSVVTTGDLLRLGFYGVLLAGVVAESRDDLADLRAATMEVRRLAEAEFAAAALEERARLAREIHDGLAQELWYAKLKQSRLAQIADFGEEPRQLSLEVEAAIDMALAEARHAVAAMRGGSEGGSLLEILRRQVEDFSDRFAIRTELVREGSAEPEIGPRANAELIRIVQEALTNVRKHADATVVRVVVATNDDDLRIAISDNGRGFRPDAAPAGFGLESMRQRAAVIGARLSVTSAPHDGSRVELVMPLASGEGTRAR
jgi:signal transduction histidine kinase